MLVLTRKVGEEIVVPGISLTVEVLGIEGNKIKLGFSAPPNIHIHRREVYERIKEEALYNLQAQ